MKWKVALGCLALAGVAATAYQIGYRKAVHDETAIRNRNNCLSNIRQLDGAVQTWALEQHKAQTDSPTWEDLKPYLRHEVVCPSGGTYRLGTVGSQPTCSIPDHNLPHD